MQQMVGQFGIFNPAIALPFSTYSSYAHAVSWKRHLHCKPKTLKWKKYSTPTLLMHIFAGWLYICTRNTIQCTAVRTDKRRISYFVLQPSILFYVQMLSLQVVNLQIIISDYTSLLFFLACNLFCGFWLAWVPYHWWVAYLGSITS